MMERVNLDSLRHAGLFPHQAQFIIDFLKPDSAPYHQLVAPTGMGKSLLVGVLVNQMIDEHHAVRILVLTDVVALQAQLVYVLQKHVKSIPVIGVNRRVFRELEASVDVGLSPWDKPIVAVMSLDLAKQKDIGDSLASVKWDLVVVDEARRLLGQPKALIDRLIESGAIHRLLLITATPGEADDALSLPGLVTTKWSRDVVNWDGRPLFRTSRERRVVVYRRGSDEIDFLVELQELSKELIDESVANLQRSLLLHLASSSLYAIEQSLLSRRNRLAHGISFPFVSAADRASELERITKLIEYLDGVTSDAKLQALLTLVQRFASEDRASRICIFSSFATTVSYLYSSLRDAGKEAYQLTGSMSYEERRAYHRFSETGGVLVASSEALTGLDLAQADIGINYDLPAGGLEIEQRWGRLDRVHRTSPCIMYAFKDMSGVLPLEAEALELHGFEECQQ